MGHIRSGHAHGGIAVSVEVSVDQQALQALTRALNQEDDGKKLRRDLAKNIRQALDPAVDDIKSALMSFGHSGLPAVGGGLGEAIAKGVRAEARLSGQSTGARIRMRRTPGIRGFTHAPRRLNSPKGWRHPVFGNRETWVSLRKGKGSRSTGGEGETWVHQMGIPGFFDKSVDKRRDELHDAVLQAMEDMAERIAHTIRRDSRSS